MIRQAILSSLLAAWIVLAFATHAQPNTDQTTRHLRISPAPVQQPSMTEALTPGFHEETPGNAALLYYQAATLRPQNDQMDTIFEWLGAPLADLAKQSVDAPELGGAAMYGLVRRAALRESCDWQTPVREGGMDTLLPELAHLRMIAHALSARTRIQMARGDIGGALDTIRTGLVMARDIQTGPTLIQGLVGVAVATIFVDRIEEIIQLEDGPNLYWALTALPDPLIDVRAAIQREQYLIELLWPEIDLLREGRTSTESWERQLERIVNDLHMTTADNTTATRGQIALLAAQTYPAAREYFRAQGWTERELDDAPVTQIALLYSLDKFDRTRDSVFKWLHTPYPVGGPKVREIEEEINSRRATIGPGWPFDVLLPSFGSIWARQVHLMDRRIAMLRIVEAVRAFAAEHGRLPTSLDEVSSVHIPRDPATGEPFAWEVAGDTAHIGGPTPDAPTGATTRYTITLNELQQDDDR